MRPIRLELTAFGAFAAPALVAFEELGERRLFLIQGATGAGKTTLLDAITFALYGAASGAGTDDRGKLRSHHAAEELATRVALTFRHAGRRFRIERAPSHTRRRAKGTGETTTPPKAALWRIDEAGAETLLAEGVRDVDEQVASILNLDLAAFRTVVLLPQGEFRDLLTARSADREEILGRLFGTGLYTRIQDALASGAKALAERVKELNTRERTLLDQAGAANGQALGPLRVALAEAAEAARAACIAAEAEEKAALAARDQARADAAKLREAAEAAQRAREEAQGEARDKAALALAEQAWAEAQATAPERDRLRVEIEQLKPIARDAGQLAAAEQALQRAGLALDAARARREASREHEAAAIALREQRAAEERAIAETAQRLDEATLRAERASRQLDDRLALDQARAALPGFEATLALTVAQRDAARATLASVRQRHRAGLAAQLARALAQGSPCPVCGGTHHPAPARGEEDAPDDAAVEMADAARARAEEDVIRAEAALHMARTRIVECQARIGHDAPSELALLQAALASARASLAEAERATRALNAVQDATAKQARIAETAGLKRAAADAALAEAEAAQAKAATIAQGKRDQVPEAYRAEGAAQAALTRAGERLQALQEAADRAGAALAAAREAIAASTARAAQAAEAARRALEAAQGLAAPDLAAAEALHAARQAKLREATEAASTRIEQLRAFDALAAELERVAADRATAAAREEVARDLADTACGRQSGAMKLSFARFVLGRLFEQVLDSANQRLGTMSGGRYALLRAERASHGGSAAGLDLEVEDSWTGRRRGAGTLSGGEGFLAALALALGVVDTVQAMAGGAPIDTLFIDEGFGSLDPEALELAMAALTQLQSDGRLVGVISHVEPMKERITAQLEVVKGTLGSSVRWRIR